MYSHIHSPAPGLLYSQ